MYAYHIKNPYVKFTSRDPSHTWLNSIPLVEVDRSKLKQAVNVM